MVELDTFITLCYHALFFIKNMTIKLAIKSIIILSALLLLLPIVAVSASVETVLLDESFEGVTPSNIPVGFTKTGDWGTYAYSYSTVLYGDVVNYPYASGADSTFTSPVIDLSTAVTSTLGFYANCDTEYKLDLTHDYMALEVSGDGTAFTEILRFNETELDKLNEDSLIPTGNAVHDFQNINIPGEYLTSNFQFQFRWVTDGDADKGGDDGCWLDNLNLTAGIEQDTERPIIILIGDEEVSLYIGDEYIEPGAMAIDDIDGNLTPAIIIGGDTVDTSTVGSYVITYNVSDQAGNAAFEVLRTVFVLEPVVIDDISPIIALNGTSTINLFVNDEYIEEGAVASDDIDGDIIPAVIIGGDVVDTALAGLYNFTASLVDENNATGTVFSTEGEDLGTFNLSFSGSTGTITIDSSGILAGIYTLESIFFREDLKALIRNENGDIVGFATATFSNLDLISGTGDGSLQINSKTVDTSTAGTYVITYNVTDAAGNPAEEVTRTVIVTEPPIVDTTPPVITLIGEPTIYLNVGDNYIEEGATALDDVDGNISNQIVINSNAINTSTSGAYDVTYNVTDNAGNPADEVTRTVIVEEVLPTDITPEDLPSLLASGILAVPEDTKATSTPTITVTKPLIITVAGENGTSTITLAQYTIISSVDGNNFDATLLTAGSQTSLSGLASGVVIDGFLQWGIEDLGLEFSSPIDVSIFVGEGHDGETLDIVRSINETSDWTSDGITDPATCVVASGYCQFSATKASYYAVTHTEPEPEPEPAPAPSSGGGGGGGGGGGSSSANVNVHTESIEIVSTSTVIISWHTGRSETSRVVYDTESHDPITVLGPNFGYASSTIKDSSKVTFHSVTIDGLDLSKTYYFRPLSNPKAGGSGIGDELTTATETAEPTTSENSEEIGDGPVVVLGITTESWSYQEEQLVTSVDNNLTSRVIGFILLQVEEHGEAWYVDEITRLKYYMANGPIAYEMLRTFGLGITNDDLAKIPIGLEERFEDLDIDGDGLPDKMEEGLKTDVNNPDTDGDGFSDGDEALGGFNPLGEGKMAYDNKMTNRLMGRILLQVESRGEAWYVNPNDGKRYYMKNGDAAYQIMRFLSLGITNEGLRKIPVGYL